MTRIRARYFDKVRYLPWDVASSLSSAKLLATEIRKKNPGYKVKIAPVTTAQKKMLTESGHPAAKYLIYMQEWIVKRG